MFRFLVMIVMVSCISFTLVGVLNQAPALANGQNTTNTAANKPKTNEYKTMGDVKKKAEDISNQKKTERPRQDDDNKKLERGDTFKRKPKK